MGIISLSPINQMNTRCYYFLSSVSFFHLWHVIHHRYTTPFFYYMSCDTKLLVLYNTLVEMWQAQEETRAWISGTFCGCTIDDVILYFLHYQHSNHRRICRERT